jgi:2-methylisocitrate lyase-like PEP mutase family enzyme
MTATQQQKAERFRALHNGPKPFLIPNPWDVGSALVLEGLGFPALATSSAASAAAIGRKDGGLSREEAIAHAAAIVAATELPVSADLENGFGDTPEDVALTVRHAAEAGLVGCTIEDSTRDPKVPLYDFNLAVERIAAGVEAANSLGFPFMLTARAHNFFFPGASLDDTIRRLQAYERAGAPVLFAPSLPDLGAVRQVCSATTKPFNFMVGLPGKSWSVDELADCGVRRISLATSLYRAAMTGFLDAAEEVLNTGSFAFVDRVKPTSEFLALMKA